MDLSKCHSCRITRAVTKYTCCILVSCEARAVGDVCECGLRQKTDTDPPSQIKAVIVAAVAGRVNERHIAADRNKHFGEAGPRCYCSRSVVTAGLRESHEWVKHPPPQPFLSFGRTSTQRNVGMGQSTRLPLVLKTNLGAVIHKSLADPCLETPLCTFSAVQSKNKHTITIGL